MIYSQLSYIVRTILSKIEAKSYNCSTREEKKLILANHEYGKSYSEIAGIERRSKNVVYHVISRCKADKTFKLTQRTGRPPMTTKREDRMIVKMSLKDSFDTASVSREFCEQIGKPISRKTVSRKLNKENFVAQIPCRKPLILKKNQKVRFDFATENILWTENQWNMVHFRDVSKFSLFGSDGKRFVRRKNRKRLSPQCVKKTEIWRGTVMVLGMSSTVGVGPIVRFHGDINVSVYKELLCPSILFFI